jgi:hypothetical protein
VVNFKKSIDWGAIMLRQILLVSLAMTASATFIPTRADAFSLTSTKTSLDVATSEPEVGTLEGGYSLTFTPNGEQQKEVGDEITFNVHLKTPSLVKITHLLFLADDNELSYDPSSSIHIGTEVEARTVIASLKFIVYEGLKKDQGGLGDLYNLQVKYDKLDDDRNVIGHGVFLSNESSVDVVPKPTPEPTPEPTPGPTPEPVIIPEPLTIFGTATALGWGVLFKRKSSKRKES